MSEHAMPIGDDDLNAWVDGRLDGARRDAVAAYLADHPEIAAAAADDARLRDALRDALRPKFEEPIPARLRVAHLAAAGRQRARARARAMAAALAAFAVGLGGGWFAARELPAPPAATLVAEATLAHRTFAVEVAHPVEVAATQQDHLMRWLSKRLGRPLAAPDLSPHGFRLMGGRLLPGGAGAAAQLMYEDGSGRRLTLYVEVAEGGATAFRFAQSGGEATFAWVDRGFGFAVTAPAAREALLPIAESVYRQLGAPPAS